MAPSKLTEERLDVIERSARKRHTLIHRVTFWSW